QKEISAVGPAATQALLAYDYPGNVRELENIIERGVIYCRGDRLEVKDLLLDGGEEPFLSETPEDLSNLSFREAKDRVLQMFHSQYVESLLRESGGNVSRAAETAGIQRQYLHRLMKEVGIDAENFKDKGDP
ncbi:MAG: sigma-54-dependent Fis family transcriptional regulator, partial [Desulfobacterales bacterium]|nr:sigma-54-dependent Fis family transcriptional regulator [Desulfobacterales bacterium]